MLILDATTKKLEFHLAGAVATNELHFVVSYVDILSSDMSLSALASNEGLSSGAAAVTLIPAPASGHTRQLKTLSIRNTDTAVVVVTVQVDISATDREVAEFTLAVDDVLYYEDAQGWYVLNLNGELKNST